MRQLKVFQVELNERTLNFLFSTAFSINWIILLERDILHKSGISAHCTYCCCPRSVLQPFSVQLSPFHFIAWMYVLLLVVCSHFIQEIFEAVATTISTTDPSYSEFVSSSYDGCRFTVRWLLVS